MQANRVIVYVLLSAILGIQVYANFIRGLWVDEQIEASDAMYQRAVFDSSDNKGVMHQVFRQNEVDRELLKAILHACK